MREDQNAAGKDIKDVDAILTARELGALIEKSGIDFNSLDDSDFDLPLGMSSGAGVIFGASGGVMEAALRTAYETITGDELKEVNFETVRGNSGIKKATVKIGDNEVNVAVAHGLANARKIMDEIKEGKADYQFVEIMACPGGCVTGGGQPIVSSKIIVSASGN